MGGRIFFIICGAFMDTQLCIVMELFCPILFHRIKIMQRIQMENTNKCQAMNSPRGEMKLTHHLIHRSQKTKNISFTESLFY